MFKTIKEGVRYMFKSIRERVRYMLKRIKEGVRYILKRIKERVRYIFKWLDFSVAQEEAKDRQITQVVHAIGAQLSTQSCI